jgi:hypothetical protein
MLGLVIYVVKEELVMSLLDRLIGQENLVMDNRWICQENLVMDNAKEGMQGRPYTILKSQPEVIK